jgi:TusA-related sulfurtransferase
MPKMNVSSEPHAEPVADRTLDITAQVCPMTFVRTRLALDCMATGQILRVLLRGDEPRRNVPATATAQGHVLLAQTDGPDGVTSVWLRRG